MYRENLVNICSGLQAPGDVENDLMVARDKGSNELEIFLGKRFGQTKFHSLLQSKLLDVITKYTTTIDVLTNNSALIIDGMVILQQTDASSLATFGDLAVRHHCYSFESWFFIVISSYIFT